MSRKREAWYPDGWGPGPCPPISYAHPSGALVVRGLNPENGLIEWGAVMDPSQMDDWDPDLIEFHGEDLTSALSMAIEWVS